MRRKINQEKLIQSLQGKDFEIANITLLHMLRMLSRYMCVCLRCTQSCLTLAIPWIVARQAP